MTSLSATPQSKNTDLVNADLDTGIDCSGSPGHPVHEIAFEITVKMAEPETDVTQVIAALEDQTWRALQRKGPDFLQFLTSDAILQFPFGMQISGGTTPNIEEVMTSKSYVPWKTYRMSHVVVTPVGPEGAVISYKVKASRPDEDGQDSFFWALISSVWRKEGTSAVWKMCFHQQTPYEPGQLEDMMKS